MSKFSDIVWKNNETFYNYDTGRRTRIWPRITATIFAAFLLVAMFDEIGDATIGAILTVQSILMGFSFSILFFLLSPSSPDANSDGSIEKNLTLEKVSKLSKELFYNVSYFNLVAVASAFTSLLILLFTFDGASLILLLDSCAYTEPFATENLKADIERFTSYANGLIHFVLYSLLAESMYTFARTVGRVSFYFEKRLSLEETHSDES